MLSWIFAIMGTPTETEWPGFSKLSNYVEFEKAPAVPLSRLCPAATANALLLMGAMLKCNPNDRISCEDALKHPYFTGAIL